MRRKPAADHQHAPEVAEIDCGLGRLSGLRPRARPFATHHLRQLFRRSCQKARQRLPRRARIPWYRSAFPSTRIGPFKNSETEIELTARGFRLATSVGGTLTGRGGEIIIIDDPLKPDDALSETKRSAANQWFTNTLLSRLDDKRTGAIVVVMQRVHIDDLTGFLLSQSDEWDVLSLPAVAYFDEIIPLSAERTYCRQSGEALSPEREPLHVLEALKLQLGSDAFSAQYQQAPAPPGGAMVKRHWIKRYSELPPAPARLFTLQSWDTASKGGPDNDWSVCTTWHCHISGFTCFYCLPGESPATRFQCLSLASPRSKSAFTCSM